ncbi:hypothetical protein GS474_25330 [Rhodococcus hoagii]|nr:hypothetical protein [Prescottella equi]
MLCPNGSGKTSLLSRSCSTVAPTCGTVRIAGTPARAANAHVDTCRRRSPSTRAAAVTRTRTWSFSASTDKPLGHRPVRPRRTARDRRLRHRAGGCAGVRRRPHRLDVGRRTARLRIAQALVGDPKVFAVGRAAAQVSTWPTSTVVRTDRPSAP